VRWDRESRHRTLRIKRDVIEDRLRELLNKNLHDPITFEPNVSDDLPLTAMWRSTISYVYQQVVDFPELSSAAHMGRMYLNILVDMLLLNQEHNYSDDIRDLTGAVHPWHVRKAKQYIDQLIEAGSFDDEELRIEAIAEYTGISTRTLQASFARFVGDTPLKYIRHRKIERLHLALQNAPTSKRVTDVMTDLGINNCGRYSGYYKRRYGTSPSSTLRDRLLS